ncbi:hypothetical protein BKA82DRAFT_4010960 [Pisolithus tinctorius]|nr:hypothetical protein BKA82DRAFT_4010960 [Pisolithus tinctorius]
MFTLQSCAIVPKWLLLTERLAALVGSRAVLFYSKVNDMTNAASDVYPQKECILANSPTSHLPMSSNEQVRHTLGGELWSALDLVDLDVQIWMSKCRLALDGLQISWCVTLRYQPTAMFEFHGGLVSLTSKACGK